MENNKMMFYVVAIVAIVAIFAMVMMAVNTGNSRSTNSESTLTADEAGMAIRTKTIAMDNNCPIQTCPTTYTISSEDKNNYLVFCKSNFLEDTGYNNCVVAQNDPLIVYTTLGYLDGKLADTKYTKVQCKVWAKFCEWGLGLACKMC